MEKVVIIGANSFQNPLILKAQEMGFETHVFAWADGDIGEKTADFFHPISIVEKEKILAVCKKLKPVAVVSIASDLAAITVNYVARELGLPANSARCVDKTTNKYLMRQALQKSGVRTPLFSKVNLADCKELTVNFFYPLIVKPTDRSGSRSITKIASKRELLEAVAAAVEVSFEHYAIVEEYLTGDEYSMETISYHGEHHALAITKKYTTGAPSFIETAHLEPSLLSLQMCERVQEVIFTALTALEIENGASHSEFKVDENGDISIIEIGARMGGDCIGSHLVQLSTGLDFVQMVLDVGLGKVPRFTASTHSQAALIKFIMSQADLDSFKNLCKEDKQKLVISSDISVDSNHVVIDSSSRYGFYIMVFEDKTNAQEFLKKYV